MNCGKGLVVLEKPLGCKEVGKMLKGMAPCEQREGSVHQLLSIGTRTNPKCGERPSIAASTIAQYYDCAGAML